MASCRVCLSPHRREIEGLVRSKEYPWAYIAEKYCGVFGCEKRQLEASIRCHIKGRHKIVENVGILHPSQVQDGPVNLETFSQKLLDIANRQVFEDPSKVKVRDALAAQKLLIEKAKVKIGETALMMSMAKLFGGFEQPIPIKGEEVVDGTLQPNQE